MRNRKRASGEAGKWDGKSLIGAVRKFLRVGALLLLATSPLPRFPASYRLTLTGPEYEGTSLVPSCADAATQFAK